MLEDIATPQFALAASAIIVPAYLANGMAFIFGGGRPLDGGRLFWDGKRILGDGKTVKGILFGILWAGVGGVGQATFRGLLGLNGTPPILFILYGFIIGSGALLGDLTGAFIKRRLGMPRGAPAPGMDQLNFIFGASLLAYPLLGVSLTMFLFLVVVTPLIHLLSGVIGYKAGKKREPW